MTAVITKAGPTTMTTFDEDTTMTTGESASATFDDLPDEIRRMIMMKRADGQAWESNYTRHPIWVSSHATKRDLLHFCRLRGLRERKSWTKHELRQLLVNDHTFCYLRHMRECERVWQPPTFKWRRERLVRAWWSSRYPELAW